MTILLECKFGSQVYGTNTPESDVDIGRVLLEPRTHIFGIQNPDKLKQIIEDDQDVREMYLRRFVKLCVAGNPNVFEWLYTPSEHIIQMDPLFEMLIWGNRHLFLNKKKLIHSHLGFAKSQWHKMRNHEKEMGAKRKRLYHKFGYDVKYASHAIRLMYQLQDILNTGEIQLPYPDNRTDILRGIKAGEMSLSEFDKFYAAVENGTNLAIDDPGVQLAEETDYEQIANVLEQFYLLSFYPNSEIEGMMV